MSINIRAKKCSGQFKATRHTATLIPMLLHCMNILVANSTACLRNKSCQ